MGKKKHTKRPGSRPQATLAVKTTAPKVDTPPATARTPVSIAAGPPLGPPSVANPADTGGGSNQENIRFAIGVLFGHLHMHDGHIYTILAFYGVVFSGGFVYNLDKLAKSEFESISIACVIVIGLCVCTILIRLRCLVNCIARRIRVLEVELDLKREVRPVLPDEYGDALWRTAHVAILGVFLATVLISVMIHLEAHRVVLKLGESSSVNLQTGQKIGR